MARIFLAMAAPTFRTWGHQSMTHVYLATTSLPTGGTEGRSFRLYAASMAPGGTTGHVPQVTATGGLSLAPTLRLLCSFHYWQRYTLADIVEKYPGFKFDIFVDSGAFTASTKGTRIKLAAYTRWIRQNAAHIDAYMNLDVIGNAAGTRRNQEVLEAEGLTPVPAFHWGSDPVEFDRYVECYPRVALGGIVPLLKTPDRLVPYLDDLFNRGLKRRADLKLHGLGMTSWSLLTRYPWDSVDSSSWVAGAKFATPSLFDPEVPGFVSVTLFDPQSCFANRKLLYSYGVTAAQLSHRSRHDNAVVGALGILSMQRAEAYLRNRVYLATGQPALMFKAMDHHGRREDDQEEGREARQEGQARAGRARR